MKNKYLLTFLFSLLSTTFLLPQVTIGSENKSSFSIIPYYQYWTGIDNTDITQYSSRFLIKYFVERNFNFSLQGGYASSQVLENKFNGLSDIQLSTNYKIKELNIALDLGVNLPLGNEKIKPEFFPASVLLAQDLFYMKYPVLGQGTNFFAGLTWAKDISDFVIIGLGASYQIKGDYSPLSDNSISYKPSNELLVTAGIDFRLSNTSTLSGDAMAIFYGKDKINDEDSFSAGTKTIFSLMFRQYFGYNNLLVFLRYRYSLDDLVYGSIDFTSYEKIVPNNLMTIIDFKHYVSSFITLHYMAEARFYQKTIAPYSGFNVYGIGLGFNANLSTLFSVPIIIKYYRGNSDNYSSVNGIELSLALDFKF